MKPSDPPKEQETSSTVLAEAFQKAKVKLRKKKVPRENQVT